MNAEDLLACYAAFHPGKVRISTAELDFGFAHGAALELISPSGGVHRFGIRVRRGVQIPVRLLAGRYRRKLKRWLRAPSPE